MPCITFPAPSLKFRTLGFPQYGFKLVFGCDLHRKEQRFKCEAHMHPVLNNLYATKAANCCSCGPYGHDKQSRLDAASQSRGPWLSSALCCRSRSSLNMASSEAVCPFRCLIFFVHRIFALRPRMGWNRQIPQFALRICDSVPSSVPRRSCRVHLVVSSSTVIAFTQSAQARQPQIHARRFSRGCVTWLQSSLYATARSLARPSPARTFTTELSPDGSPHSDVGYNYTVKQPIAAAGLTPARYAALWAAGRPTQKYADKKDFLPGRPVFARGFAAASLAQAKASHAFQA
jgi:hypothetical protein